MVAGGRFSLIISVILFAGVHASLYARTAPTVISDVSRDTLSLHDILTNTVRVTLAADWPQTSFCVFPESPDSREAFALLAAYPSTRFEKTPEGQTRVFEMRYVLRAQYVGQARLGNTAIYLVDGETLLTNSLPIPDSTVLIEGRGSLGAFVYILMALGLFALGIFMVYCWHRLKGRD
jgi:hypothetical protein